jgi:hypothetical protein
MIQNWISNKNAKDELKKTQGNARNWNKNGIMEPKQSW